MIFAVYNSWLRAKSVSQGWTGWRMRFLNTVQPLSVKLLTERPSWAIVSTVDHQRPERQRGMYLERR